MRKLPSVGGNASCDEFCNTPLKLCKKGKIDHQTWSTAIASRHLCKAHPESQRAITNQEFQTRKSLETVEIVIQGAMGHISVQSDRNDIRHYMIQALRMNAILAQANW